MTKEDYIRSKIQDALDRVSASDSERAMYETPSTITTAAGYTHKEPTIKNRDLLVGGGAAATAVGLYAGAKAFGKWSEKRRREKAMMKGYAHAAGWNRPQHFPMFSPHASGNAGPGYGHYGY